MHDQVGDILVQELTRSDSTLSPLDINELSIDPSLDANLAL